MRILIVGGGGREHALAWAVSQSPHTSEVFIAPGNAGTSMVGINVPIAASDVDALLTFATNEQIDLTIVGPEQPLVAGVVDRFEAAGKAIVGPTAGAAQLEGSKAFAKAFMQAYGIPTAGHRTFESTQRQEALAYLEAKGAPIVVKASGLAAGKGAIVCMTRAEAQDALREIMEERTFGEAGDEVVIEDFMTGEEASLFALCDGKDYVLLAPAQDHKRVGEGDTGPNTGGMGAYAPAPVVTKEVLERACREVIEPTLAGMQAEGHPYKGVLYIGLMITEEGPKVVEYNCRFGDPEAQIVLPLVDGDLVEVFKAMADGTLKNVEVQNRDGAAACVVMASAGYPGAYEKGFAIDGIEQAATLEDVVVFQAGTRYTEDGRLATNGGRVLAVAAVGHDLSSSLQRVYAGVEAISFEGAQFRRDIGQKGLARLSR